MQIKTAYYRLKNLRHELRIQAYLSGRYPAPYSDEKFDNRDKNKAFRCMHYNRTILDISALETVLKKIKSDSIELR